MSDITYQDNIEIAGDLSDWLADHIFMNLSPLRLGSVHSEKHDGERCWHRQEWDLLDCDEPGFENYEETAILLKRKSDGKVIEVELGVDVWEVEPEDEEHEYEVVYDDQWSGREQRIPFDSYEEAQEYIQYELSDDEAENARIE